MAMFPATFPMLPLLTGFLGSGALPEFSNKALSPLPNAFFLAII
jgi:hypothetical protein